MKTHSSVYSWKISWTEEPGGLQCIGSQSDMTEATSHTHRSTDGWTDRQADRPWLNRRPTSWLKARGVCTEDVRRLLQVLSECTIALWMRLSE